MNRDSIEHRQIPFITGRRTLDDERQRLVRYRAGYYAFITLASTSYLYWLSGLIVDEKAFTLTAGKLGDVALWFTLAGVGVFAFFSRSLFRESTTEARIHYRRHPWARKRAILFVASMSVAGVVVFFSIFHLGMHRSPLVSLLLGLAVTTVVVLPVSIRYLRPPSVMELAEQEQ